MNDFLIGVTAGLLLSLAVIAMVHIVGLIVTKRQLIKRGEGFD